MNFVHFSDKPLGVILSMPQESFTKPRGLWLSVEDDDGGWSSWCVSESWGLDRLVIAHAVSLRDDARILFLRSASDIDDFTAKYQDPRRTPSDFYIRWDAVAECHQGIVIAPYCHARRLHRRTSWYYGWDCASGCVWDAAAIGRVAVIEHHLIPERTAS